MVGNKLKNAMFMLLSSMVFMVANVSANITLEKEIKITDGALHFDGVKVANGSVDNGTEVFDYFFGPAISAHGDSIKSYKNYIFMTWYKGGKHNREVMLSRYNTQTGIIKHIEFPHKHTGYIGQNHIGESHNSIAVAVSPIDGSIHLLYDMHAYSVTRPEDGSFSEDYFRYSYSYPGAAEVDDEDFVLGEFVKNSNGQYKHLTLTGDIKHSEFSNLTYPTFFTSTEGVLLAYMRKGGNNNGAYVFSHYNASEKNWSDWSQFNVINAKSYGNDYNWGLYGSMKYLNGKLRVGFQQRANREDRYLYQNGVFYAASDHPSGDGHWKNHKGDQMTFPLINSDEIKIYEPGDYIHHQETDSVYIVSDFDWTVTTHGDVHIISKVRSTDKNRPDYQELYIHSYKPNGENEFIIDKEFTGATNIYSAGKYVYIIGLNNFGRPFVERALGGSSSFERVYESSEGRQFRHGKVYIDDGKLYYYLMEKGSTASQPLYLQIINLDIEVEGPYGFKYIADEGENIEVNGVVDLAFGAKGEFNYRYGEQYNVECSERSFGSLLQIEEKSRRCFAREVIDPDVKVNFEHRTIHLNEGYQSLRILVEAKSSIETGSVREVDLYIDGEFVSTKTEQPYLWDNDKDILNLNKGTYQLEAIAKDDFHFTGLDVMTLTVESKNNGGNSGSTMSLLWLSLVLFVGITRSRCRKSCI